MNEPESHAEAPEAYTDPAFADPEFDRVSAPVRKTTAPMPINERAEEWQKQASNAVESALLGIPTVIRGHTLNKFTTARGSLLRRINNEFVNGVPLKDIRDPFLAVGRFLVIMSATLQEARELVVDEKALDDKAYGLLDSIPFQDVPGVVKQINAYVHGEMQNQVHGSLPETEGSTAVQSPKNS